MLCDNKRVNRDSYPSRANRHKITQLKFFLDLPPSHSQPWSPPVSLAADTVAARTGTTVNCGSLCCAHPFNACCPGKVPPGTGCCYILHTGAPQQVLRAGYLPHSQRLEQTFQGTLARAAALLGDIPAGSRGCWQPRSSGARAVLVLRVSMGCSAFAGCRGAGALLQTCDCKKQRQGRRWSEYNDNNVQMGQCWLL